MPKVLMLSGLPASGKSTFARELVTKEGWGRVNRDDLRESLFGGKWSYHKEKVIVAAEKGIAQAILGSGRNVVIDDTNLGDKHYNMWSSFALDNQANFEQKLFPTPLQTCIDRDAERSKSVGRNVIVKMAARYGLMDWPDRDIVLVDIDGTLADGSHREHYVRQEPKDWENYLKRCGQDKPIIPIFKWVAELSKDYTIVIVSGRGAERENITLEWFKTVWSPNPLFPEMTAPHFPVFQYFFRDAGDHRPDDIVKLEVLKLLPRKPIMVIDDRPSVIRAWRSQGLKVIPVRGAIEEF